MSLVLNEKMRIGPMSGGSVGSTWSIFSETFMRMTSISWPQLNSMKNCAPSASVVELSFLTPDRVERISSTGLVISFSIWRGCELG